MLTATRRKQLAAFTVAIYILTISAIIHSYNSSRTFLQMSLKLNSGVNVLILMVFGLLNLALIWNALTWMLFGELRLIEQEHIFERVPFSVLGIIIMTSMFSEYHLMTLLGLSGGLIALKIYHWILKDRLEQRLQAINSETKFRNLIFSQYIRNLIIFGATEFWVSHYFWTKYIFKDDLTDDDLQVINIGIGHFQAKIKGRYDSYMSVFLLFGMEFCVLFVDHLELMSHTILNYYEFYLNDRRQQRRHHHHERIHTEILSDTDESDIPSEDEIDQDEDDDDQVDDGLENKFIYEKIIDIVSRIAKMILHVLILYRLQVVVIKDIIWDIMSLYKGITSLWKIYKNNRQLDDKLPNIEIMDLMDHDNICIVCMDDLVSIPSDKILRHEENENEKEMKKELLTQQDIDNIKKFKRPKKLPCGHMLHLSCLKNWMERSQTCPICRLAVFDENGKVKPSVVPLRSRSNNIVNNTNMAASNTDTTTDGQLPGTSNNSNIETNIESPIEFNDEAHESWYTFDINDIKRDSDGPGETINFTAETLPHLIGTPSGGNQLPLSLQIRSRDQDVNGAVIVNDSKIRFPDSEP